MGKQPNEYILVSRKVVMKGALLFFQFGLAVGIFLMLVLFASH
jgi:hypothetical protein